MDEWLMRRAADGDSNAFAQLVERHQRFVMAMAYQFLHSSDEAEDAAQEVFIKLYKNLHKYHSEGKFRAFLSRITANECISRLRRAAAMALAEIEAISEILQATQHENPLVREMGARSLTDLDCKVLSYENEVERLLRDPNSNVRREARWACDIVIHRYKMFQTRAYDALQKSKDSDPQIRLKSISMLVEYDDLAIPTLLQLLRGDNSEVRQAARQALENFQ